MKFNPLVESNLFESNDCNNNTKYYTTNEIKDVVDSSNNNLTMICSNIRSLNKNFDSFKEFLCESDVDFKVIGLVETWLKDKPHDYYHLKGYNLETCNRNKKKGGGVCLYVDDHVVYNVRNDLSDINNLLYTESLFIEIENTCTQNTVIGVIYRPPDQNINEFNKYLDNLLSKISVQEKKHVYIMGDFNINLLNEDVHGPTGEFVNTITSFSFYPSITKPTRITNKSATLIDNILTNNYAKQISGIILTDISDHLPIFVSTNQSVYKNSNNVVEFEIRDMNSRNIDLFKGKLSEVDWDDVCSGGDCNESYNMFIDKFSDLYDECIPKKVLKKKINRSRKPKVPWISCSLLKCIHRKNKLYKKYVTKPTDANLSKFKLYRNKLNSVLRLAKQKYFSEQLDKERYNMRNTWKVLNSLLRSPKKSSCHKFVCGNKTCVDPKEISNKFNEFFASIGPSLAETIKHQGKDFNEYLVNSCNSTCFFMPTDENEILKIISKLGSRKSPGYDLIKSDLVKLIANEIVYPLKIIINKSLCEGIVPDALKIAKVVPIYKKESPESFGNYRPVSVLPCFSKILERIVHDRCCSFLDSMKILYNRQYGFRHNHSTYMAVLDFIKDVNTAFDNNMYTASIFMDLSKAFDTIDHNILLQKLYHYGFRGTSYNWFADYLKNRKQYVSFNNVKSSYENVRCGVPQGSILGPLLFILYMNDICTTSKKLSFILFADDTTVFHSANDIDKLCKTMNHELKEIVNWFKCNKLSLNAAKTNFMIIGTPHQTQHIHANDTHILLDGCKLSRVCSAKFLGVTLDENLTWKPHINRISKHVLKILVYSTN